ncbi:MAG: CHASE2 domain-containing sensor protein/tRNA A-37 threonylcarbamoyl transferase component Bud32 [Gammaproteobacteria bacterium]
MKKGFWTSDWFAGAAISIAIVFALNSQWLQSLERSAYDWGVGMSTSTPSDRIAIIAIDDQSIDNIGRWPWPRDVHAQMVDLLLQGGAKVVGTTVFFTEAQTDPGFEMLTGLADVYANSGLVTRVAGELDAMGTLINELGPEAGDAGQAIKEFYADSSLATQAVREIEELGQVLVEARAQLDADATLAASVARAKNIVFAMPFVIGEPLGNPDSELPEFVRANAIENVIDESGAGDQGYFPLPTNAAAPPIERLGTVAAGIGHLNANPDIDGGIRSEPLVVRYYDSYYPSLSLLLAAKSRNLDVKDIQVRLGDSVKLGPLNIKTDPFSQMNTFFYSDVEGVPAFATDSFFDVITESIPPNKYKGKIVLIGATAFGVGAPQVTPISPAMAPVITLAHSVSSILNEDFFVSPAWAGYAEWGILLLAAAFLIALLPKLRAATAASITTALVLVLFITHLALMTTQGMWLQLMAPVVLLLAGYLLLTTKRFLVTERGKERSDMESAETNRMLGLSFQGQGQLDQAFDHFKRCPIDERIMDLCYNLALDFERKRQFNKAGAVYNYITEHDEDFRDVKDRQARTRALEDTVMFGGTMGSTTAGGTLMLDASGMTKPMLGRYEVEKELGKGAMGVVYLGKDPKINRVVAIKTMALSQEFEADELDEVKERFFREAETAGRLTHPNIVTIYDAGEEHDLAFIAMEFLKGQDLAGFTKPGSLLDISTVIEIVAASASALNYAHGENVVHRDIKPANIMYEPESGQTKLTDFGIARITDSSKTKTGMVLGTPSYMSPEQLSGKRVDGRSDLFSLGVMLFQMLTGQLPFKGDSMATLMFMIANEPHPDLLEVKADLPPALRDIVNRALDKNIETRYQTGAEMEKDLLPKATAAGLSE